MDWVRLRSAIERNRTPHIQWVRFPNKSNSIEQIELNRTQSVWLSSIEFGNRTQSNTIKWISFDCLWWIYTKKALSKPVKASFSRAFFTIYSITQTSFINCPRQLREQNRTKQSSRWRWPNCPRSFAIRKARPFSPIFFKTYFPIPISYFLFSFLKTSPSLTSKRHSW